MATSETGGQWVLEPPGPGEVHLSVSLGEGAQLSPAARAAVETLLKSLLSSEVEGFLANTDCPYQSCLPFECQLKKCQPLKRLPCMVDMTCRVADLSPR
jgi:hypothetical protein